MALPPIERAFVKPASAELQVRIPHTMALLPADGGWVPLDMHWRRLIRDGDVVQTEPPAA